MRQNNEFLESIRGENDANLHVEARKAKSREILPADTFFFRARDHREFPRRSRDPRTAGIPLLSRISNLARIPPFPDAEFAARALRTFVAAILSVALNFALPMGARAYAFNQIVPDVRQPVGISGGSACPVRAHQHTSGGGLAFRWSTALNASPATILTQDQTATGRLNEIEQVITQSLAVWTGVSGTTLVPASLAPLTRTSTASACGADGVNSICFDQPDMGFTPGVLAFTRVLTADVSGEQIGSGMASTEPGQILDADVYFSPANAQVTFATPQALPGSPHAYDLESLLTHELGHALGFSHSAVWSAMMYPYAPAPGTFTGMRPTAQAPDAPLGDDDRTGLRVLYPAAGDTAHAGTISGRVLPANPLSLPISPPGVTGIFGAHIVAVNAATGAVVAGTIGGWSCSAAGPAQFDGSYSFEKLPTNGSYLIYAEPLNGTVGPEQISDAIGSLCRNPSTDAGWPQLQGCAVPAVDASFTARALPEP